MDLERKQFKILFTGVGRRVELLQAFRCAAQNLNVVLRIYGADISDTAPALLFCDEKRLVCHMSDSDYIPELLRICKRDQIDLVIPTIDTDLLILASSRSLFAELGTRVLISEEDNIAVCRDKNYTAEFFIKCGLKSPVPVNDYRKYSGNLPCFIKPKDGSSSINAFRVNNRDELAAYAEKIQDYIVQPFIEGTEFTVDIMCDFYGNPVTIVPRERLVVRSGEVLKTRICMDENIIRECERLVQIFRPCGPITVQLIKQKKTGINFYIEINPRFGGGVPLSIRAGADSAEIILQLLMEKDVFKRQRYIHNDAIYSRFDQSVRINSHFNISKDICGVIFDLDDTLYSEKDYVRSGFRKIGLLLQLKFPNLINAEGKLWSAFLEGKPAIDTLLHNEGIEDENLKAECLKVYREQIPDIKLYPGVLEVLKNLKAAGIKTGIITDGRVEGQKSKIRVLGLEDMVEDIIITDELGGEQFRKPDDISFRLMQKKWQIPFEKMVYVGDNPLKDFMAPSQLGMETLYYQNPDGIYYQDSQKEQVVSKTISDIREIIKLAVYGQEI